MCAKAEEVEEGRGGGGGDGGMQLTVRNAELKYENAMLRAEVLRLREGMQRQQAATAAAAAAAAAATSAQPQETSVGTATESDSDGGGGDIYSTAGGDGQQIAAGDAGCRCYCH